MEAVDLPLTCLPLTCFTTFAFRSSEVRRLLLDLDPYGGTDPLGMFLLFLKITADVMAPLLSVVVWRLVRLGSFPAFLEAGQCHPNSQSTVLFACELPTNFHNISIVSGV